MPELERVANATNTYSSETDELHQLYINKDVDVTTSNGYRFWGRLERIDNIWLFIRGKKGQAIAVRRSKVSSIMEAV